MTLDVVLATFSVVQLVLSAGAALIAFSLRKTFEGGIFERAWQVIAVAPIVYALGQAIELVEAAYGETSTLGALASVVEVAFLVILVSGFFMFASAWGGAKSQVSSGKQPDMGEDSYAKAAKGALVFILGRNGASATMLYTGEPHVEDFDSRLHKVLGNGAATVMRHMAEDEANQSKKVEGSVAS